MNYDLKMIKKHYGEEMAHFCRGAFSTLLEQEGVLFSLIDTHFGHSKAIYENLVNNSLEVDFIHFIQNLSSFSNTLVDTGKSVEELLSLSGYKIYSCSSEAEIQSFRKYYAKGEELCTFRGGRLRKCHVFFAVRNDAMHLKRKDFSNPERQDAYGTSVISIQFTRGCRNNLSIKNRYNHTVSNPDATFGNNLDNIIPGLTKAFEHEYGFHINQQSAFSNLEDFVLADDGKYYFYYHEENNICYGPDNVIIDGFKIQQQFLDKSRYIVFEMFVLDLVNKCIYPYDLSSFPLQNLDFCKIMGNIEKITVTNMNEYHCRKITIINDKGEDFYIYLNRQNRIVGYVNNHIKEINIPLLDLAYEIEYFQADNLEKASGDFIGYGVALLTFIAPKLKEIDDNFLMYNGVCEKFYCPSLEKVGNNFLRMSYWNRSPVLTSDQFVVNNQLHEQIKTELDQGLKNYSRM